MQVKLKHLNEQVVVVTGASSGIGLATARAAARRGARVVLSSRDAIDLERAVDAIRRDGGRAAYATADVADPDALRRVAELAVREFGRIDTWVNNAGITMYGRLEEVPLEDARRLFDTNYWGVVHGSLAALPHLRREGGALINIGSVLSDTGIPLQGHYTASKHAVKGFTNTLRLELEKEGAPISVTLVKPAAINTPYPEHARNYMGVEPKHPPPVYAPEVVARAILTCAEHPRRDVFVGGGAKMMAELEEWTPRLGDRYKERAMFDQQRTDQPAHSEDVLYSSRPGDSRVHGRYPGRVMRRSAYTGAALHPTRTLLGLTALGAGLALAARTGMFETRGDGGRR